MDRVEDPETVYSMFENHQCPVLHTLHSSPSLPPKPTLTTSFNRSRQQATQPCSRIAVRTPRMAGPSWSYSGSLGSSTGVARITEFPLDICSIQNDSLKQRSGEPKGPPPAAPMSSPNLPASHTPPIIPRTKFEASPRRKTPVKTSAEP